MKKVVASKLKFLFLFLFFLLWSYFLSMDFALLGNFQSNNFQQIKSNNFVYAAATRGQYAYPFSKKYPHTDRFGAPRPGRTHQGLDIAAPTGTIVLAAQSGEVTAIGEAGGYGLRIIIKHPHLGGETLYAHLSSIDVSKRQKLNAGDVIGKVGSTGRSSGPHLHFEIRKRGVPVNPISYMLDPGISLGDVATTPRAFQQVCHNTFMGTVCVNESVNSSNNNAVPEMPKTPRQQQECTQTFMGIVCTNN